MSKDEGEKPVKTVEVYIDKLHGGREPMKMVPIPQSPPAPTPSQTTPAQPPAPTPSPAQNTSPPASSVKK